MGNDSSTQKHAALWLLARNGDAAELRMAIARVPPELKCSYLEFEQENATPLTIAVKRGHVECVGVLLSADVDVNHIGIDGLSALHIAVKKNDPAIVRLLVENDAVDCNVVDPHGCTPLFLAAIEGHVQVLDLLLHCGAVDVFARELQTHKDLLTLARIAYSQAGAQNQPRFQVCLDLITKRLANRCGSLWEFTDEKRSIGWQWIKRNYMVFRTADPLIIKIDLFAQLEDVNPSTEMTWQCSEMIEEAAALASLGLTSDSDAFIEKPFRFALRVRGIDSRYDLKTVVLAAESQEELEIWNDFSKQLQIAQRTAVNATRTRIHNSSSPLFPKQHVPTQQLKTDYDREILERRLRQLQLKQQQRRQEMQQRRMELEPGQSSQRMQELEALRIQNRLLQEQEASRREEEQVNRRLFAEKLRQEREAKQSQELLEAQRHCVDLKAKQSLEELEAELQYLERKAERKLIDHERDTLRLQEKTRREQETRLLQEHIEQEQVAFRLEQREHDELEALWAQQARKNEREAREFQDQLERERQQQQRLSSHVEAVPFAVPLAGKARLPSSSPSFAAPVQAAHLTEVKNRSEANCIICLNVPKCAVCVPCGHVAMCMDCAAQVKATTRACPVCSSSVSDIIQILHV